MVMVTAGAGRQVHQQMRRWAAEWINGRLAPLKRIESFEMASGLKIAHKIVSVTAHICLANSHKKELSVRPPLVTQMLTAPNRVFGC